MLGKIREHKGERRRKPLRRCQMTTEELQNIVDTVRREKLSHKQASVKFGVTTSLVSGLVVASKRKQESLAKAKAKEELRRLKLRAVLAESAKLLKSKQGLMIAKQVQDAVQLEHGVGVSRQYVGSVLREDLGVRYRAIKRIPFQANQPRCTFLRMEYAKFMLRTLSENKRVICIDQSWLNDTQFTRRRWRKRGEVNTMSEHQVTPRISLLMAIGTDGELYAALTQVNTDHKVFCLFMTQLAKKLS